MHSNRLHRTPSRLLSPENRPSRSQDSSANSLRRPSQLHCPLQQPSMLVCYALQGSTLSSLGQTQKSGSSVSHITTHLISLSLSPGLSLRGSLPPRPLQTTSPAATPPISTYCARRYLSYSDPAHPNLSPITDLHNPDTPCTGNPAPADWRAGGSCYVGSVVLVPTKNNISESITAGCFISQSCPMLQTVQCFRQIYLVSSKPFLFVCFFGILQFSLPYPVIPAGGSLAECVPFPVSLVPPTSGFPSTSMVSPPPTTIPTTSPAPSRAPLMQCTGVVPSFSLPPTAMPTLPQHQAVITDPLTTQPAHIPEFPAVQPAPIHSAPLRQPTLGQSLPDPTLPPEITQPSLPEQALPFLQPVVQVNTIVMFHLDSEIRQKILISENSEINIRMLCAIFIQSAQCLL